MPLDIVFRNMDKSDAIEALVRAGFPPETELAIRGAYAESGMTGAWAVLVGLLQAASGLECTSSPLAGINLLLWAERYETVLHCIEESVAERTLNHEHFLKVNPRFDPVREDPRFQVALEKMGVAG